MDTETVTKIVLSSGREIVIRNAVGEITQKVDGATGVSTFSFIVTGFIMEDPIAGETPEPRHPEIGPGMVFWQRRWKQKCRVVAVLSDEKEHQVVYKYFRNHEYGWRYEVQSLESFAMFLEEGCYTTKRKRGGS